jgi:hypothetical protein
MKGKRKNYKRHPSHGSNSDTMAPPVRSHSPQTLTYLQTLKCCASTTTDTREAWQETYTDSICDTTVHDWVVCKLSFLLATVGHRVKIHKVTPAVGHRCLVERTTEIPEESDQFRFLDSACLANLKESIGS